MPTLKQAIKIGLPLIAGKKTHAHYDYVVKLAREMYRPLITGNDADHLIRRFNQREDEAMHKQRIRLTQLITPAIANTLMSPARKIPKVRPVVDSAVFKKEGETADTTTDADKKLADAAANFYAGKNVDHYFGSVLLDQGAVDPNAFCLLLYNDFDNRVENARAYPSIISCADAWNYEYLNGSLQWLLVHRDYEYEVNEKIPPSKRQRGVPEPPDKKKVMRKGHAFWVYTDQHHIMFLQRDKSTVSTMNIGAITDTTGTVITGEAEVALATEKKYYYRPNKEELYEVRFYEHKSGMVQAFRLGFVPDQNTKGETMVNLWHAALPFMLKGVKAGSELDISASLHAFLQKISYENPCKGYTDTAGNHFDCNEGKVPGGNLNCKACGGSGLAVHASGQDHLTLRMPDSKDEAFDLSSITHYVPLPVEVLTWQDSYVDKLENKSYRAVYNSDRFRPADPTTTTATGDIIDLQAIYDTLKPCADWYSQSRVLVYKLLASFVVGSESLKYLEVSHAFPRNMRFETLAERVNLMKSLREAGASNGALLQVDRGISEDLYVDDPAALQRALVMASFNRFLGKSEGTVLSLISQDLCTRKAKVYWTNEAGIYDEAEARFKEKGQDFWTQERKKQRETIDEIVAEIISEIDDQAEAANERATLGLNPEDPALAGDGTGTGDPTGKDLPPSPGKKATE